jgi:hypothetical protein
MNSGVATPVAHEPIAHGDTHLTGIDIRDGVSAKLRRQDYGGLFVFIGADAETGCVFACGDVRLSPVKRVASAVGEGSMAIASSTNICSRTRAALSASKRSGHKRANFHRAGNRRQAADRSHVERSSVRACAICDRSYRRPRPFGKATPGPLGRLPGVVTLDSKLTAHLKYCSAQLQTPTVRLRGSFARHSNGC